VVLPGELRERGAREATADAPKEARPATIAGHGRPDGSQPGRNAATESHGTRARAAIPSYRHAVVLVPIALAGAAALVSETLSGRSVRFFGAAADQRDG
jgi:hypothetical protein